MRWLLVLVCVAGLWQGSAWAAGSNQLCSNGGQYSVQQGGGCCGDGIVNGPSGVEECDNGSVFNDWNNIYESVPPGTNLQPCSTNCSVRALGGVGSCQPWGNGYYYQVGEIGSLTCTSSQLFRKLYDDSTCTAPAANAGVLPNTLFDAGCRSPVCNNSNLYGCSFGFAINQQGNGRQCNNGGVKFASCGLSVSCSTDCEGTCDNDSGNDATDYNGSAAGCGSPPPPIASCQGTRPANSQANTSTPSSNTIRYHDANRAGVCSWSCNNGFLQVGGTCQQRYTRYQCQSNGTWTSNGSCTSQVYTDNPNHYSSSSLAVCIANPTIPKDSTCAADASCGASFGSCNKASASNLNNNLQCSQPKTWSCGTSNCSQDNPTCPQPTADCPNGSCTGGETCSTCPQDCGVCITPINGVCNNSSPGACTAGISSNPSLSISCGQSDTWTCNGINSGNPDSCRLTSPGTPISRVYGGNFGGMLSLTYLAWAYNYS